MNYLYNIYTQLDLPDDEKDRVMRELRAHYKELKRELIESGIKPKLAKVEAERRMGDAGDVAARLSAVHNSSTWKSAILSAVPFIISAIYLLIYIHWTNPITRIWTASIVAAAMLSVGGIALKHSRMPIWSAAWLGSGLSVVLTVISSFIERTSRAGILTGPRAMAIASLALAVIATLISWNIPSRRKGALIISSICTINALAVLISGPTKSSDVFPSLMLGFIFLGLLIYMARSLFEFQPYGNVAKASLFMLTIISMKFALSTGEVPGYFITGQMLCGVLVVCFARAPQLRTKSIILLIIAITWNLGSYLSLNPLKAHSYSQLIISFLQHQLFSILIWYAFTAYPLWMRSYRAIDKPQVIA